MSDIIRGTTPTFTLTVPNTVDLTTARNVYATFRQGSNVITKKGADLAVSVQSVDVYLDQIESLSFTPGAVEVQLNWTFADGTRAASTIATATWADNLVKRELE